MDTIGDKLVAIEHGPHLRHNDLKWTLFTFPLDLIKFLLNIFDFAHTVDSKGL